MPQTDQVCTDLHKFSCAPGVYHDGTGHASSPDSSIESEERNLHIRTFRRVTEKFKDVLKDPENGALRTGILSASGLSISEDCRGAQMLALAF